MNTFFSEVLTKLALSIDNVGEKITLYGMIGIQIEGHKGIIDFCFNECFRLQGNLRIDTHRDNIPMQKCLIRNGFEYCGVIYLANGDERLAYQKTK